MDISININKDTNDNLCRHLIEIESLHLGIHQFNPPYKGNLTKIKESLGNSTNGCFKDKGMQNQVYKKGAQFHYDIFSLQSDPPLMLHSSSIYSPSIGSEGSKWSISWHMEDQ